MMSDFSRINRPRVVKILGQLANIQTSARSQRATTDEIAELLGPVHVQLDEWGQSMAPDVPAPTTNPGGQHTHTQSHWNSVIHMARTAPLKDAIAAMSIIANRVEEELMS